MLTNARSNSNYETIFKIHLFTRFVLVLHVSYQQSTDYTSVNWSIHWFSILPARNQGFSGRIAFLADTLCAVIVWERRSGSTSGSRKDRGRVQSLCSRKHFHRFRSAVHTVRPWKCVLRDIWRVSGTALERHSIEPYTWSKCLDSVAMVPKKISWMQSWSRFQQNLPCPQHCCMWIDFRDRFGGWGQVSSHS